MHKHKCDTCGHIWQHGRECAGDDNAHTCSQCGKEQWTKYFDEGEARETSICSNGIVEYSTDRAINNFLNALIRL